MGCTLGCMNCKAAAAVIVGSRKNSPTDVSTLTTQSSWGGTSGNHHPHHRRRSTGQYYDVPPRLRSALIEVQTSTTPEEVEQPEQGATDPLLNNNHNNPNNHNTNNNNNNNLWMRAMKRSRWALRPGYSSGASSLDGSRNRRRPWPLDRSLSCSSAVTTPTPRSSRHNSHVNTSTTTTTGMNRVPSASNVLALSSLRQEMVADGHLSQTVVRIEPSFGRPIEDVYDGVSDGLILGSGVSGVVRLVTHKATLVKYAVKILDLRQIGSTLGLKQLRNEIYIMCQLDHPNIVRIEEVYESNHYIYIVQELCLGGDLFDRLDEQPEFHYTEHECAKLVKQMLSAVRYLHSKGIIHRDLKLENFLFSTPDPASELRMIDFGLSKHFCLGQLHHEKVGTPYTVAPEVIRGQYDEKGDIWALGVITYLLLSGETPFGGLDGEHPLLVKRNIERAQLHFAPAELWHGVSPQAIAFVQRLLNPNPLLRPTAKECQRDAWIQVWGRKKDRHTNSNNNTTTIHPKTISALMAFKEQSDMQKLLSKVLSFTLQPEQLVELRTQFETMDTEGKGEISLHAMKGLLLQYAETGALGPLLTEQDIHSMLESMAAGKPRRQEDGGGTIGWREFLSTVLSQAKIDDRNLQLAFDRMDMQRKGYITLQDLRDMLGHSVDADNLEKVWLESLTQVESNLGRIDFDDFKRLMKGHHHHQRPPSATTTETTTETTSRSLPHEHEQQGQGLSVSLHISSHSHHSHNSTNSGSHHHHHHQQQPNTMEGTAMLLPKQPPRQQAGGQSPYLYANMLLGVGIFAAGMAMNGVSLWDWEEG